MDCSLCAACIVACTHSERAEMNAENLMQRLTSRKFLFALGSAVIAGIQFAQGAIDANAFVTALVVLSAAYGAAEGIADAGRG